MTQHNALAGPAIQEHPRTVAGRVVKALNRAHIHIALALIGLG